MAFLPDTNVWISLLKNPGGKLDVNAAKRMSERQIHSFCYERLVKSQKPGKMLAGPAPPFTRPVMTPATRTNV